MNNEQLIEYLKGQNEMLQNGLNDAQQTIGYQDKAIEVLECQKEELDKSLKYYKNSFEANKISVDSYREEVDRLNKEIKILKDELDSGQSFSISVRDLNCDNIGDYVKKAMDDYFREIAVYKRSELNKNQAKEELRKDAIEVMKVFQKVFKAGEVKNYPEDFK